MPGGRLHPRSLAVLDLVSQTPDGSYECLPSLGDLVTVIPGCPYGEIGVTFTLDVADHPSGRLPGQKAPGFFELADQEERLGHGRETAPVAIVLEMHVRSLSLT